MADAKVSALTALSGAMTLDDLLYAVNDPGGTPASRKATAAQVLGLDQAFIRGLIVTKNSGGNTLDISAGYCFDPSSGKVIYYAGATALSAGSLGASQWNQVYIYDNAGTSTIEVVNNANPPSTTYFGTARQGGTNSNRRWIGSFLTTSGSAIYAQDVKETVAGQLTVTWLTNTQVSPFRVLSAGTSTTYAAVSLLGAVPRYATTQALLFIQLDASSAPASVACALSQDGTNIAADLRAYVASSGSTFPDSCLWMPVEVSVPQVQYKVIVSGGSGPSAYINVPSYQVSR